MTAFLSIHRTNLRRLVVSYYFLQLGVTVILACLGRLTPSSALNLLVIQPIVVVCIGSASFGLRLAKQRMPKLELSPAIWVGLSYMLTALSEVSWHEPSLAELMKWGGLGLLSTLLIGFRCLWIESGRRLPLGQKVATVGLIAAILSLGIFSVCSISHQQRANQAKLTQDLTARLMLLGSQIEGGQRWQALMDFPPSAQVGVFSSDGALQFYRGSEQSRRDTKELGWRLPAPSGSFTDTGTLVVWKKLESGLILLARQSDTSSFEEMLPIFIGSLLATMVVLVFLIGAAKELSSQRETSFGAILDRLREDQGASVPYFWDPELQVLADRLIDWGYQLRYQRDNLLDRVESLSDKSAAQSRQIASMGQRLKTLKSLQESLRLDSAIPLVGKHLENLSREARVRIWLNEAGRSFLVYGTEFSNSEDAHKVEAVLATSSGTLGKVEFAGPYVKEDLRLLQRALSRMVPFLEQTKKVEEGNRLATLFHSLLEPQLPVTQQLQIAYKYVPSKLLSGDLLDVFSTPTADEYIFVVADVLGKGPVAAATALRVKEHIRYLCQQGHSLSEVTSSLNNRICNTDSRMLTLFIGRLEPKARRLTYCSAGHEEVYLRSRDGEIETLQATSMMLGVLPDGDFEQKEIELTESALLLLLTDGVTESRNDRAEQFGPERVREALKAGKSAVHTTELAMFRLKQHCTGDFNDDVSILCIELP